MLAKPLCQKAEIQVIDRNSELGGLALYQSDNLETSNKAIPRSCGFGTKARARSCVLAPTKEP